MDLSNDTSPASRGKNNVRFKDNEVHIFENEDALDQFSDAEKRRRLWKHYKNNKDGVLNMGATDIDLFLPHRDSMASVLCDVTFENKNFYDDSEESGLLQR